LGLVGILILLALYILLIMRGLWIAARAQTTFGRVMAGGLMLIPMRILLPAYVTSELKTAFQIGFTIFIPFLIIDLVIASVLMA
ncbi:FtsW/RodA/SpoVE family cell cycle protein, partial [Salmonella enterica subsp. enterica serovar Anatum]|nr:FtsW/RodA/SpoVE family cell cycle protein [Salmonella enterica subsp. enterica serovar Anatum]